MIQLFFVTIYWQLVRTFAVRFTKIFREDLVSLHLPRRAKKLNVDDLGDCGGDLRGELAELGSLETKSDGRHLPMGSLHPLLLVVWRAMTSRGWCFWRRRTHLDSFRISSGRSCKQRDFASGHRILITGCFTATPIDVTFIWMMLAGQISTTVSGKHCRST